MDLLKVGDDAYKRVFNELPNLGVDTGRYTIASGEIPNMSTDKPAIVMTHQPGLRYPTTIGDCKRRERVGIIYFQVRYPAVKGGDTACMTIAEKISRLFESVYVGNSLRYNDVELRNIGRDGAWYLYNVVVNYSYEEIY